MKHPDPAPIMYTCQMCGSRFQFGPHRYDGKFIRSYQLMVCRPCHEGNHDGWSPLFEAKLERHLEERGIPLPARNTTQLYPRE